MVIAAKAILQGDAAIGSVALIESAKTASNHEKTQASIDNYN
jgi:hypothetical protein